MGRPSYQAELRDKVLTLMLLDFTSLGRYTLSEYLNLTKAKTRSVLENLNDAGLVVSKKGRAGTSLTSKGQKTLKKIKKLCLLDWNHEYVNVDQDLIGKDTELAIILINVEDGSTSGLYERDMAVRQGAEGAITLKKDGDYWKFPNDDEPVNQIDILRREKINHYNLMSITFGDSKGAVYAATTAIVIYHLQDELEKILNV